MPRRLLARVLADVEVEGTTVDLDDQPVGGPTEVGLLARDAAIELRKRAARLAEDLHRANLGSASRPFKRQAGVAGDYEAQPSRSAAPAVPPECIAKCADGCEAQPDCLSHCPRESTLTDTAREIEERPLDTGDRYPAEGGAVAIEGGASVDDQPAVSARSPVPGSGHGFEFPRQRPDAHSGGGAHRAQDRVGRGQGRRHPPAPFIMSEDGRDREDALLDKKESPALNAAGDRSIAQAESQKLRSRNAVELESGQLRNPSITHHL